MISYHRARCTAHRNQHLTVSPQRCVSLHGTTHRYGVSYSGKTPRRCVTHHHHQQHRNTRTVVAPRLTARPPNRNTSTTARRRRHGYGDSNSATIAAATAQNKATRRDATMTASIPHSRLITTHVRMYGVLTVYCVTCQPVSCMCMQARHGDILQSTNFQILIYQQQSTAVIDGVCNAWSDCDSKLQMLAWCVADVTDCTSMACLQRNVAFTCSMTA